MGLFPSITDPYGNTTSEQYDSTMTELLSTTNPAGETTGTDYTTAAHVAGLVLDTYVSRL